MARFGQRSLATIIVQQTVQNISEAVQVGTSISKAGQLFPTVGALLIAVALLACDTAVYHPDEVRAEKQFKAIPVGTTEESLTSQLGKPMGRLVFHKSRGTYQYFRSSNDGLLVEFKSLDQIIDASPPELRMLPSKKESQRILVFVDGTVVGYFYIGQSGRVEDKVVVVS